MESMNDKNGSDVSTGELAQMIAAGFHAVDKRFDAVDKRFDAVDRRFDTVEGRLGTVEGRLDTVEGRLGVLAEKFDIMDARLGRIQADVSDLREEVVYRHEFDDVRDRVKYIERKLAIESGV